MPANICLCIYALLSIINCKNNTCDHILRNLVHIEKYLSAQTIHNAAVWFNVETKNDKDDGFCSPFIKVYWIQTME